MEQIFTHATTTPWYRTRKFWGIIFCLYTIISITFFVLSIHNSASFISINSLKTFIVATGGIGGIMAGGSLAGEMGAVAGVVIYYLVLIFTLYKTFFCKIISIYYPLSFSLIYLAGMSIAYLFIGSLA